MKMDYNDFYVSLGRLYYAISKSDDRIQKIEVTQLQKYISEELLKLDNSQDEFGTNNAYYTEFEFESLCDSKIPYHEAYKAFEQFYEINKKHLSKKIKQAIYKGCEQIATANNSISPNESLLLSELKNLLDL